MKDNYNTIKTYKKYRSNFGEVDVVPAKNDKVNKMET